MPGDACVTLNSDRKADFIIGLCHDLIRFTDTSPVNYGFFWTTLCRGGNDRATMKQTDRYSTSSGTIIDRTPIAH